MFVIFFNWKISNVVLVSAVQQCKSVITTIYIPSFLCLPPTCPQSFFSLLPKAETVLTQRDGRDWRAGPRILPLLWPTVSAGAAGPLPTFLLPSPFPWKFGLTLNYWSSVSAWRLSVVTRSHIVSAIGRLKHWEINTSGKAPTSDDRSWRTVHSSWCLRGWLWSASSALVPGRPEWLSPRCPGGNSSPNTYFALVSFPFSVSLLLSTHVLGSTPNKSFSLKSFLPEEPKWRRL